jgi:hypothetical protein
VRGAAVLRSGRWRRLGRLREEDDAGGGPSRAQSKNGPEDLMGHHGEVGRDGLGRKMKIKPEINGFNGARAELRWAVEKFLFKF